MSHGSDTLFPDFLWAPKEKGPQGKYWLSRRLFKNCNKKPHNSTVRAWCWLYLFIKRKTEKPLTLPLRWAIRLPLTLPERPKITDHYVTWTRKLIIILVGRFCLIPHLTPSRCKLLKLLPVVLPQSHGLPLTIIIINLYRRWWYACLWFGLSHYQELYRFLWTNETTANTCKTDSITFVSIN